MRSTPCTIRTSSSTTTPPTSEPKALSPSASTSRGSSATTRRCGEREVGGVCRLELEVRRRDDVRAALARDVDESLLPGGAVVGGRGDIDLDAGLVERDARERHVVLPADQAAEPAEARRNRLESAAVALAPDEALVVGGDELAVVVGEVGGR